MQLVQVAKGYLEHRTSNVTRLRAIVGAIVAAEQLANDAQKALQQQDLHSEVLKWIGGAQVAKLDLEQILKALDADPGRMSWSTLDHLLDLERTHAITFGDILQNSLCYLGLPHYP